MAFWNFGRKKKLDVQTKAAIEKGVYIINLQMQSAAVHQGFDSVFHSAYVRGYLTGVFMASMQAHEIPGYGDDTKTMAFVAFGLVSLIGEDHGLTYALASLRFQDEPEFFRGNFEGGNELVDFMNQRRQMPTHLLEYFQNHSNI